MSIFRKISTFWVFLTLILPFVAARWDRRHQELAQRARGDVVIHKRQYFDNARFTYYAVGLGACGQTNVPSDWIVALTVDQYGSGYPGPECFKTITILIGSKTAQATIVDECMGCPYGGLDFSQGLFEYFADTSEGVLWGSWWFNDNSGAPTPTTTPWQQPTSSSTPDYTPPSTPAYTPPSTSSTPAYTPTSATDTPTYVPPTPTPTTTSTTTSTSSTSPSSSLPRSTSGSATPTPAVNSTENIPAVNLIMIELGMMLSGAVENE